ncbi:hypothetical protein BGZ63DRAFT_143042 [Mariannaea sp. PMI_226]|nr:hypothetical protein BGZ63DRAFT_143042 [Mariannaea sp. PMI_226]
MEANLNLGSLTSYGWATTYFFTWCSDCLEAGSTRHSLQTSTLHQPPPTSKAFIHLHSPIALRRCVPRPLSSFNNTPKPDPATTHPLFLASSIPHPRLPPK